MAGVKQQRGAQLVAWLWGKSSSVFPLIIVSAILCLGMLGMRELWTQEGRWGSITWGMLVRSDYLHPYCYGWPYYDKPLLTYWLPLLVRLATGQFNEWALRLPSALAGIASVLAMYQLGLKGRDKRTGLVAAWLLVSTFFFVFWARVASADALNLAGILVALACYFSFRNGAKFRHYLLFFMVLAATCLCKGVVALAIVGLVLLPDVLSQGRWRRHLRPGMLLAMLIAAAIYLLPFYLSTHFNSGHYSESGLGLVFRENFLRYFSAFDHKEPFYVYFYYLPAYTLPWCFFLIPALVVSVKQWSQLDSFSRWSLWALLLSFLLLDLSESRRNYYTLMLVPFALLVVANWLASDRLHGLKQRLAAWTVVISSVLLFSFFLVLQPLLTMDRPLPTLAKRSKQLAEKQAPWSDWQVVMVDATVKMPFYLQSPHVTLFVNPKDLATRLPKLEKKYPHLMIVSRTRALSVIKPLLAHYRLFTQPRSQGNRLLGRWDHNATVIFLPKQVGVDRIS